MCGIFCSFINSSPTNVSSHEPVNFNDTLYEMCRVPIIRRGPDSNSVIKFTAEEYDLLFAASVLWLQGNNITQQPIETNKSIFVYNGDIFGGNLVSDNKRLEQGDTISLLKCLESSNDILKDLLSVQGPYAFIYLDKRSMKLYFSRDKYGRRSLIIGTNSVDLILSSVFIKNKNFNCIELPALGIFCFDFKSRSVSLYPWPFKHSNFSTKLREVEKVLLNITIVIKEDTTVGIPPKQFLEPTDSDLICYKDLLKCDFHTTLETLLRNPVWLNKVTTLGNLLETAVKKRIATQPLFCQNCINNHIHCCHTTTGILFSGGIDCAILALLADKYTDPNRPIDLLNVSFSPNAPDRITGKETLDELKKLCPNRTWNFVEIDVTNNELEIHRQRYIKDLIYPLTTVLDDSLGCALWFASRGMSETYWSPCRVLLVGMGADELFGGYTKHRLALKRGGWTELNGVLEEDWQNISFRNLARDDRVVSDHGRQLRTPYLDEDVVEFVRNLNCWERTCPSENLPQGLGEKILLRSYGYHLGLVEAAILKKRALQFGSRIANRKENARDICPRL